MLRNAIFYARNLLLQTDQDCEGDEFFKSNFFQPTFKFNQRILNLLTRYSELSLPVDPEKVLHSTTGLDSSIVDHLSAGDDRNGQIRVKHVYSDVMSFYGWEVPNLYVMYQAYKMHKELKDKKYP